MKFPEEMKLFVTAVHLGNGNYTHSWVIKDDETEVVDYGTTEEDYSRGLKKGSLVRIVEKLYIVTKTTMDILDYSTTKTTFELLEVDEDVWVVNLVDKLKGER